MKIAYYSLYGNNFADIQCYDEYGITLFSVSRLLVGSDAFFRLLTLREVPAIDFPFPKEEFLHFNIVGIEYLGKVYLKPQEAEAAESSNYQSGRTMMFVFYGIGGALILFSVFPGVRFRRYSAAYRAAGNSPDLSG